MSEPKMWQVTAECAWATIPSAYGMNLQLVHKGGLLPEGTKELKHLIESGMVEKVGDHADGGLNAEGEVGPATTPVPVVEPPAVVEPPVAETPVDDSIATPLPADGSAPPQNASKATWVEYAVSKGMDRTESAKSNKADLIAALRS